MGDLVFGANDCGNIWASGRYTWGGELIDEIMDIIRRHVESCNCPQGFQLMHSLGGGTGGGLGSLIASQLRDYYPPLITTTFSVCPSAKMSQARAEPYNAILSFDCFLQNVDATHMIDNEALYNIAHDILKIKEPTYSDLNWVASEAMTGITLPLRFHSHHGLNSNLGKMLSNMVPFRRLRFLLMSLAPILSRDEAIDDRKGKKFHFPAMAYDFIDAIWSSRNYLSSVKREDGKFLCATNIFRGCMYTDTIDDGIAMMKQKMADDFVSWIPNNFKDVHFRHGCLDNKEAACFLSANTTATKEVFRRINCQFAKLWKGRSLFHRYRAEGMDGIEFVEATRNVWDLIMEYQDKQDAIVYLEEDDDVCAHDHDCEDSDDYDEDCEDSGDGS